MAKKRTVKECGLHGEYFADVLDSPCPSCEEQGATITLDFSYPPTLSALIDALTRMKNVYGDLPVYSIADYEWVDSIHYREGGTNYEPSPTPYIELEG